MLVEIFKMMMLWIMDEMEIVFSFQFLRLWISLLEKDLQNLKGAGSSEDIKVLS